MLKELRIKQLALIEEVVWELEPGLNILTGETGAGKSILIDAFQLLLGERADREMIREGASQCSVEALLDDMGQLDDRLMDSGLERCEGGQMIIRRMMDREKAGRQFVNGSATTVQNLKAVTRGLVDIHGPHDHQSLLAEREQRRALDAFAGLGDAVADYGGQFRGWVERKKRLEALAGDDVEAVENRLADLRERIEEIESAALEENEDVTVEAQFKVASSARDILAAAARVASLIEDDEMGLQSAHARLHQALQGWAALDEDTEALVEAHAELVEQVSELADKARARAERVEWDEARLSELEERLDLIQTLKRKYGGSLSAIFGRLEALKAEAEGLSGRDEEIQQLKRECERLEAGLMEAGQFLSGKRGKAARKLAAAITKELRGLGFKQADFEIGVETGDEPGATGLDRVEFRFAPNPGEGMRPLSAIASSGEMARVMLAVKSVLAEVDQVPVLIFDEIDANVGGETASRVAERLRDLGDRGHQVLCITHLPQVAAAGHAHFRVEKQVERSRTQTRVMRIEGKERQVELARMLGGENASSLALAGEMIDQHSSA